MSECETEEDTERGGRVMNGEGDAHTYVSTGIQIGKETDSKMSFSTVWETPNNKGPIQIQRCVSAVCGKHRTIKVLYRFKDVFQQCVGNTEQ